ncbi:MAG: TetR/AcrR family transcriptional regulator [Actinomycetota bacterium]
MARTRSLEAREKMLAATAELLLESGVTGLTIDEVARRSGVAKTTIYRHFPDRNELIIAALDGHVPIPRVPDTGTFREDLIEFYGEILPIFMSESVRRLQLDILAAAARDPELARLDLQQTRSRASALRTIYERARERGEVEPDVPYADAFDYLEGPLIVRSLLYPPLLADLDIELMADRAIALLAPRPR